MRDEKAHTHDIHYTFSDGIAPMNDGAPLLKLKKKNKKKD